MSLDGLVIVTTGNRCGDAYDLVAGGSVLGRIYWDRPGGHHAGLVLDFLGTLHLIGDGYDASEILIADDYELTSESITAIDSLIPQGWK